MSYKLICLVLLLPSCLSKPEDVTFNNVTFRTYNRFKGNFDYTIQHSNSLNDFRPPAHVDRLEFKGQNIPVLYENSVAYVQLSELAFEDCGIREIQPGAFRNIMINNLFLNANKIEEIKVGVFNNLSFATIDLSENLITTIDSNAFDNMPNLLRIDLANNSLTRWDENWFKNTPILVGISVENNSITSLPNYAFKNLVGPRRFLIELLINVDLSHNKIRTIEPYAFRNLTEGYGFYLDYNELEEFDEDLLENVRIKYLWLNRNKITCLKGDLKKILKAQVTSLYFNPIECDCLQRIKEWAKKNHNYVRVVLPDSKCS